ncbi:MAG: NADPH-dependent F420 reductase [Cytophagales bacterium]|nr:NADPH-dependent F420 reductase [Cytophagales bacterium]
MSKKTIGFIGAGRIGRALAEKFVKAGYRIILSNRQGPGSLTNYVHRLGPLATEGAPLEAAKADVVFLAVRWADVTDALRGLPDLAGRIVVDTTNPILADGTYQDLGERTSSAIVAAQLPGARVVKAFNSLFGEWIEADPVQPAGKRVVFVSSDDIEAKSTVQSLISSIGFATVDLGGLIEGGKMQQAGKPLAGLNLLLINEISR